MEFGTHGNSAIPQTCTFGGDVYYALRNYWFLFEEYDAYWKIYFFFVRLSWQIQTWAHSSKKPGLFTGSTDATFLRPEQLGNPNPKHQAWTKKVCSLAGVERQAP